MLHILSHFVVPVLIALLFYRSRWKWAALIMAATMLVDLDHLFADPIYDPQRCSIEFHPLHTIPAIIIYGLMFLLPLALPKRIKTAKKRRCNKIVHLAGLGLLIHMVLDGLDCLW